MPDSISGTVASPRPQQVPAGSEVEATKLSAMGRFVADSPSPVSKSITNVASHERKDVVDSIPDSITGTVAAPRLQQVPVVAAPETAKPSAVEILVPDRPSPLSQSTTNVAPNFMGVTS